MPPMVDTRDWCDVDSDEDFCIPELPPLPELVWSQTSVEATSSASKTEESPRIVTPVNPQRFKFDFTKERSPRNKGKSVKSVDYVCFVGKFPNHTSVADLKSFVKSKGINFTAVRMGPKKRPNVNAFGYVDVSTRKDYETLLSLDGTFYNGRAIRVDHATRRETNSRASKLKKVRPRSREFAPASTPPLRQRKSYKRDEVLKKADVQTKKANPRFQRMKTQRSQKVGTRKKQKYRKVQKSSASKKNIRYRLAPLPQN